MYRAKASGRNRVEVSDDTDAVIAEKTQVDG
jgi:hypothetical protein